jgi:hypothetical protein
LLVAFIGEAQVALDINTTVTLSVFERVDEVNIKLSVPTLLLFIFHWYEGELPPFVGVAVKVTVVPAHILLPGLTPIVTVGVGTEFTVTVAEVQVVVLQVAL